MATHHSPGVSITCYFHVCLQTSAKLLPWANAAWNTPRYFVHHWSLNHILIKKKNWSGCDENLMYLHCTLDSLHPSRRRPSITSISSVTISFTAGGLFFFLFRCSYSIWNISVVCHYWISLPVNSWINLTSWALSIICPMFSLIKSYLSRCVVYIDKTVHSFYLVFWI